MQELCRSHSDQDGQQNLFRVRTVPQGVGWCYDLTILPGSRLELHSLGDQNRHTRARDPRAGAPEGPETFRPVTGEPCMRALK